jgi:hypothetical protein
MLNVELHHKDRLVLLVLQEDPDSQESLVVQVLLDQQDLQALLVQWEILD